MSRDDEALLDALADLVRLESPSHDAARVSVLAAHVRGRLRTLGVEAECVPCPPRGDALRARIGRGAGTLLLGHLDTVWPAGSWGPEPFRVDGQHARGPGVFDMKAGIAVAMAALGALRAEPAPRPVELLLVPDEEVGSGASRALLAETARLHDRVLVLEPSLDGAAKVARKGTGQFRVVLRGRAAHAGLEPEKGASALAELARALPALEALADAARGTSVVATQARAGSAANVVPEDAELTLDARVWSADEAARVEAGVRGLRPTDPRVTAAVEGGFDRPPLEPSPEASALYGAAREIAGGLGVDLQAARVGGASDGNLTAALGVPTLDGLGPRGGGAHARDEHVFLPDLPFRVALVLGLARREEAFRAAAGRGRPGGP